MKLVNRKLAARALLAALRPLVVLSAENPVLRAGLAPALREAATVVSDDLERLALDHLADMDEFDDIFFGPDDSADVTQESLVAFDLFVRDLMAAEPAS